MAKRPQIRLVAPGLSAFGRDITRGVIRYVREEGLSWHVRVEMNPLNPSILQGVDQCDGVIVGWARSDLVDAHLQHGKPMVNCLAHYEPLGIPTVRVDDRAVGEMAATYLLEQGFDTCFFTSGGEESLAVDLRYAGFCEALRGSGVELTKLPEPTEEGAAGRDALPAIADRLQRQPTPCALFCTHDGMARLICDALAISGVLVPDHVAVLGVDNDQYQCDICEPPLSSVEIPYQQIGVHAAAMLARLLDGETSCPTQTFQPLRVVPRVTTDTIDVGDERLTAAVRYIRNHACDPCSVAEVVDAIAVSRTVIERLFRQHLATTPHELIVKQRMRHATYLLRTTTQPLARIARQCGYPLVQNFGRAFKEIMDISPAAYRQQHGADSRPQ